MKQIVKSAIVAASLFAGAPVANADATEGLALAEEYCARCHNIGPGGAAKTYPPSFASIAWFRSEDQIRPRIMFPNLHASMPAWANWLTVEEVDSLVAYILTLEGT